MNKTTITRRIRVYGIVQGVGFRPTVSRHAMETGIRGTVSNKGPYVEIYAQGTEDQVDAFLTALRERPPKRAAILKIDVRDKGEMPSFSGFEIIESEKTRGEIFISPDIAICDDCKRELFDKNDRRYLHPFINCTSCGPRLTILDALPYDRERTSMKVFPMCPSCAAEYYDPATRRYDAQPVCCNDCGPEYYILGGLERGKAAITKARRVIAGGGIIAVKGIGGFHLACDATNPAAVSLLRTRKHRPMKPFAIMMRDMDTVRRECGLPNEAMEEILTGHQKPILLLPKLADGKVCEEAAPDNPKLGVMLPYAPIHLLLFDYDDGIQMPDCLVMTSGNVSGAPICRDDEEAEWELGSLCDAILSHGRMIRIRADDTVMDFFEGKPYMIRRSRGYAPLPFLLGDDFDEPVIGIGGELKNTFCIGSGGIFYPSPYVGDLEDLRTVRALKETVHRFETLLETEPAVAAADMHPRYNSLAVAEETGLPLIKLQHHYAHILSCMAENECTDRVVGISFDGTGYGTDGTIWGGEILLCDFDSFTRAGHIAPFLHVGGDIASREGWRIAVSMLHSIYGEEAPSVVAQLGLADAMPARVIMNMADRRINAVISTSAGRLFDAVSAICGIRLASTFEGEASMALEFAAERWETAHPEDLPEADFHPMECAVERGENAHPEADVTPQAAENELLLPTDALVREITDRRLAGEAPDRLAYLFHEALAQMAAEAAILTRQKTGCNVAALSGGCYQNLLLTRLTAQKLRQAGFRVLLHSQIPPNDGGIALGQAAAAAYRKHKEKH